MCGHEHERTGVGVRGLGGGAHDLGQLLVEGAGRQRRLGDARERLELRDAPLRATPQARVLDRLADLRRDRDEQRVCGPTPCSALKLPRKRVTASS